MRKKIGSKAAAIIFSFCMLATIFMTPLNTYAGELPGNVGNLNQNTYSFLLSIPFDYNYVHYYLDFVFPEGTDLSSLGFGRVLPSSNFSELKSIYDYDFISVSGNRVLVDLNLYAFGSDNRSLGFKFMDGSSFNYRTVDVITYGVVPLNPSQLSTTPMYIYDIGLIGNTWNNMTTTYETSVSSSVSTVPVLSSSNLDVERTTAVDSVTVSTYVDNAVTSASINSQGSSSAFLTSAYYTDLAGIPNVSTSSGYALTSVNSTFNPNYGSFVTGVSTSTTPVSVVGDVQLNNNTQYVVDDVDVYSTSIPHINTSMSGTLDSYSIVSTISSLNFCGVDGFFPGNFWTNFNGRDDLTIRPADGILNTFDGRYTYFDYVIGLNHPISDVSISGNSHVELLSWSQAGDQVIVSCRTDGTTGTDGIELSSIQLTLESDMLFYFDTFSYFYVSSYDHSEAIETGLFVTLLNKLDNGFNSIVNSVRNILDGVVKSVKDQTESLEYGYDNETKTEATTSNGQFKEVTANYVATETAVNDQVMPYFTSFNPDASGLQSLTASFGMVSGIITNTFNRLGSFQTLFTFSMTIGICLFLLQLKK